ncbi:hypothetical protein M4D54_12875 [Brachybacterium sp. p3-SID1565]|uniref:Histidine kinase n=1 Tax=Brachybacterium epidermidis TaxID=2781983 RepID=A0ABR9VXS1_9MICO|nr:MULTISPECIES: hypothetical protein [Brachybacterium]MBE9402977.1 hypothetical protein [Brachybacterium epidermidis]MCT1386499.1 hypothetical protein [Brachybacterium sp. p3-SID1565]
MPSTPRPGSPTPETQDDPRPQIRPAAALVLALEALMIAAAATAFFWLSGTAGARPGLMIALGVFLLVFTLGAAIAARSVLLRGRFGLGYGITWQLFQALVGASLLRGGLYWQGALALVLAVAGFLLLLQLVRSTPLPRQD